MIKITVLKSSYTTHWISKSSGSPWHLDSSKLKYRFEKNQYHILKSRVLRLSIEGEASDAGQGSRIRSASSNKMHSRCGVPSVDAFTSFFGRSVGWSRLQSSDSTENPQNCSHKSTFCGPEMYRYPRE
jgi:hypothetical protein